MNAGELIFYPETYIGFNKTQLLERNLSAIGLIGSKLNALPFFSTGHHFRQFIPKVDSIHKYHYGLIRIKIQAVGKIGTSDCSNVILIEGDMFEPSLDRYASLCELLHRITGDRYLVDIISEPMCDGISESLERYRVQAHVAPQTKSVTSCY